MNSLVKEDLLYTSEHEWAKVEGNEVTIGITDHAQHALGDVVYVELPKLGSKLTKNAIMGVVESVKAVSDIYAPVSGQVIKINEELINSPEWLNQEPYEKAWLIKINLENEQELKELLNPEAYKKLLKEEAKYKSPLKF